MLQLAFLALQKVDLAMYGNSICDSWQLCNSQKAFVMFIILLLQKLDLIMYGDSIFESLLGSVVGHPVGRAADNPAVWSQFHNNETDKIFALAGM